MGKLIYACVAILLIGFLAPPTSSFEDLAPFAGTIDTELVSKIISKFLLHFNGRPANIERKYLNEQAPLNISFPILPPLPDPLFLNDTEIVIPEEDVGAIFGNLSSWNSNVTGLSQLVDNFTLSPTPDYEFLFSYKIDMPYVNIAGEHDANLTIVQREAEILSHGDYTIPFINASIGLALKVKVLIENALLVTGASVDLAFDDLQMYTTETTINGEPILWDEFNQQIVDAFPAIWAAAKPNIDIIVEFVANILLEDCKFTDLVTGNITCITGSGDEPTWF